MQFEEFLKPILDFFVSLGSTVQVAIILSIVAIILGTGVKKGVRAGLSVGIGFIGIFAIFNLIVSAITPVAEAVTTIAVVPYKVLDVSWPPFWPMWSGWWGMVLVWIVMLIEQFVMLALGPDRGGTDTLDLYHFGVLVPGESLCAYFTWLGTGNILLALSLVVITYWIILRRADWAAPLVQDPEGYNLTGTTFAHMFNAYATISFLFDDIVRRIPGLKNIKASPTELRKRFGLVADPIYLGLFVGLGIGLAAYFLAPGELTIFQVSTLAMNSAAALFLMPRMITAMMEGLVTISDQVEIFTRERFPGRHFTIGLDWAIAASNPAFIALNVLSVPLILALMILLPGNITLVYPTVGTFGFMVGLWAIAASKGNVVRSLVTTIPLSIVCLYLSGFLGPLATRGAQFLNIAIPTGVLITAPDLAIQYFNFLPAIIAIYLFGGESGRAMISGEGVGIKIGDPTTIFLFAVGFIAVDLICWWYYRDLPLRIARTPRDEYIEKGPKPIKEIRAVETKK